MLLDFILSKQVLEQAAFPRSIRFRFDAAAWLALARKPFRQHFNPLPKGDGHGADRE
jgi:hypothetical protein